MRPGDSVGRFAIEKAVAAGGMAQVYLAVDGVTGERVAVKVVHRSTRHDARLEREAVILEALGHPAIVKHLGHGRTAEGYPYLAMEWLEGEDLADRLDRGRLDVAETLALGRRVADALGAAHARGVVHRDVKPANLFLVARLPDRVKLLDFGVARVLDDETTSGVLLGTPAYMAPEQARGERDLGAQADVFALGCVLYECLTGRPAFAGGDPVAVLAKVLFDEPAPVCELSADVPEHLGDVVTRMLRKEPAARPADGRVVASALGAAMREVAAPPGSRQLTHGEQRVFSVVLAGAPGVAAPPDADAATLRADAPREVAHRLARLFAAEGARVEPLATGAVAAVLAGGDQATDEAVRAARCALAVRRASPSTPVAIATATGTVGPAAAGGEVFDRAASLLRDAAAGPGGWIRLDAATHALLEGRLDVATDALGALLRGEGAAPARTLLGRTMRFVGRDAELAALTSTFEESVSEGIASAVLVTGEPGLGKSRLVAEALAAARRRRPELVVWTGRADPVRERAPFALVAQLVRQAIGAREADPAAVVSKRLREHVARLVPADQRERLAGFLLEILGVEQGDQIAPEVAAARADSHLLADHTIRAWRDLVEAECARAPVAIVLDDLHWADLASVQFLDTLLSAAPESPLCIVAAARPEMDDLLPELWTRGRSQRLRLGQLGQRACGDLVHQALGSGLAPAVVARVIELARGNAFFLEELIRAVAEGRGDALPDTVLAVAHARLARLDDEARRFLRAAAVFGQSFWLGGIRTLLGMHDEQQAPELLDYLCSIELLEARRESRFPGEREVVFRHALVRDAAYAMLTDDDRRLGHLLAAEWLEQRGERDAVALAEHAQRGGDLGRAAQWYERAAEQGWAANALDAVMQWADRAVACGAAGASRGALRRLQAEVHTLRGEVMLGIDRGDEAMRLLPAGDPRWCEAVVCVLRGHSRSGALGVAETLARELGERACAAGGARELRALAAAVIELCHAGRRHSATPLLSRLADAANGVEDALLRVTIAHARSWLDYARGEPADPEDARVLSAEFEAAGDLRKAATLAASVGSAYLEAGAYERALTSLESAREGAHRVGLPRLAAQCRINMALAHAALGRWSDAEAVFLREAADTALRTDRRYESFARLYLCFSYVGRGALDLAEEQARLAIDVAPNEPRRAHALAALALVLCGCGRPSEALVAAREAHGVLDALGGTTDEGQAHIRLALAEALAGSGAAEEARAAVEIAVRSLRDRAARMRDPALAQSFLERVPENARTLALARELGVCD